jgi:hypothetical protein
VKTERERKMTPFSIQAGKERGAKENACWWSLGI